MASNVASEGAEAVAEAVQSKARILEESDNTAGAAAAAAGGGGACEDDARNVAGDAAAVASASTPDGSSCGKQAAAAAPAAADGNEEPAYVSPKPWWTPGYTLQERFELCRSVGEECIQADELRRLLANKPTAPVCYDGFEPSGRMHLAQGVLKAINVNKLTDAGCVFKFWVADWFAQLNNKLGGDLKKIQTVGRYFVEVWKACGMNMERVQFLWASEEINKHADAYWAMVMDIARRNSLSRIVRCSQIMGRGELDELSAAQIFYPCMQCADIFFLKADICQLGMDQRKVNVLAREYCDVKKVKNKPVILSHRMMPGLKQGQEKMSKSDPESAIFMEDTEAEVNLKIKKAYCPPAQVEDNPCLEYLRHMVMPRLGKLDVQRKEENGGNKTYESFEALGADYAGGRLHPGDLKPALSRAINEILRPVREHFANEPEARKLLAQVKKYRQSQSPS